jgi:hypothetical protein
VRHRLLVGVLFCASSPAIAAPGDVPYEFIVDPDLGMEGGVRTFLSIGRLAFGYDAYLSRWLDWDESRAAGKAAAILGRTLKLVFIDSQLAVGTDVFIHEIYGHGARAREWGLYPDYVFKLFPPYCWIFHAGMDSHASDVYTGQLERDLQTKAGGLEAGYLAAWWINAQTIANGGTLHYGAGLTYLAGKLTDIEVYLGNLSSDAGAKRDAVLYVDALQLRFRRWTAEERASIVRRLRLSYIGNLVDPTLWLVIYHELVTYLYKGERHARLPLIPIRSWRLFPGTRFNLSPFGAEHYVDLFASAYHALFSGYVRVGSSGLATYWGLGVKMLGLPVWRGLALGGELDVWSQPELLLDQPVPGVAMFSSADRPVRGGVSVGVYWNWIVWRRIGVVGKLSYKTKGYMMGQPLEQGLYGYFGLCFYGEAEKVYLADL